MTGAQDLGKSLGLRSVCLLIEILWQEFLTRIASGEKEQKRTLFFCSINTHLQITWKYMKYFFLLKTVFW